MTSARRTDGVMCKGGSAVRKYTMTTIVEILPSTKKLYSSSFWKSRRTTLSSSEAPQFLVLLGEKFVAPLVDSVAHRGWRGNPTWRASQGSSARISCRLPRVFLRWRRMSAA
jgi:hypothetical protein